MNRLRIAIDPRLTDANAPEIHWTWRLLLTTLGWAWQEVSLEDECEIAFVDDPARAPMARLCIQANPRAWRRPATYHLAGVAQQRGLSHPIFQGELAIPCPVEIEDGRLLCRRDILFDVFWLVTGQEERYTPKDRHGFFYFNGTFPWRNKIQIEASASQVGIWLETVLRDMGCPPPLPRWPHGKRAAATVGHDVDYPEVKRLLEPLRVLMRQGRRGLKPALEVLAGRRSHWQFPAWVELEKRLQTRSAFYFVARQGSLLEYAMGTPDPFYDITSERFRQLFRYLAEEGFEVGLQASYWACRDPEKFAAEKRKLEEASGQPVVGNRHHYWHLNPHDIEETLLFHEQIGLKYDSSLVHDRYLGWRRGLSHPFFPFHQTKRRELKTLQVPVAWMDDQLFGHWQEGRGDRWASLCALVDSVTAQGGCMMIDIHEYVFDDVLFPGWAQLYRRLWTRLQERGDFWFATPAEIAEHWTTRYTALVQASHGLEAGMA